MEKIDYEKINQKLEEFIYDDVPLYEQDIQFEDRLCQIILDHCRYFNSINLKEMQNLYTMRKGLSLENAMKMNIDFFKQLDSRYCTMLTNVALQDMIDIYYNEKNNTCESEFTIENNQDKIRLFLYRNIYDAIALAHEFMHYTNFNSEIASPTGRYFTECFSYWIEFLFTDESIKKYPEYKKDILKMKRTTFFALFNSNIRTFIMLELIKKKVNGVYINTFEMLDIFGKLVDYNIDKNIIRNSFESVVDGILNDPETMFVMSCNNTVGLIFSSYMHELGNKKNGKKNLIELNDSLSYLNHEDVIEYLGLEFDGEDDFYLTQDSYQKLENSYVKELKRLW